MKCFLRREKTMFFLFNVVLKKIKFRTFFLKRSHYKFKYETMVYLKIYLISLFKTSLKKFSVNFLFRNKNLKNYKRKEFLFLLFFNDIFFSCLYFRKKENTLKARVVRKNSFDCLKIMEFLTFFKSLRLFQENLKQIFSESDLRIFLNSKKKKFANENSYPFFFRFKFIKKNFRLKKLMDIFNISQLVDLIFFCLGKYEKKFRFKKLSLSFFLFFVLNFLNKKNRIVHYNKRVLVDSYLIKKKTFYHESKTIHSLCFEVYQKKLKKFQKQKQILIGYSSSNYQKIFNDFQIYFYFILNQKSFQFFLESFFKKNKKISKFWELFNFLFQKKKNLEIISPFLKLLKNLLSENFFKTPSKILDFVLNSLNSKKPKKTSPNFYIKTEKSCDCFIFKLFFFYQKHPSFFFFCIFFFNLTGNYLKKKPKLDLRILWQNNKFLPWSDISGKLLKNFSEKIISEKIKNSFLICKKCTIKLFFFIFQKTLNIFSFYSKTKNEINITFRSFFVKFSNFSRIRNFLFSFYYLIQGKIWGGKIFGVFEKNLFRLFVGCTRSFFKKLYKKESFFGKIKKILQSSEGFLFLIFIIESDFFFLVPSTTIFRLSLFKDIKGLKIFQQELLYGNLFYFFSKNSWNNYVEWFKLKKNNFLSIFFENTFISSFSPNRDTFFWEKIFVRNKTPKPNVFLDDFKISKIFLVLCSNFSTTSKIKFFCFWKFLCKNIKRKSIIETFLLNLVMETGSWERKMFRNWPSIKKRFSKEKAKLFSEDFSNLFILFVFSEPYFDSQNFFKSNDFFFEKVQKTFFFSGVLKKLLEIFRTWKEKRFFYWIREDLKILPTYKVFLEKMTFFLPLKEHHSVLFYFLKLFLASVSLSEEVVIIWDKIYLFFCILTLFPKMVNIRKFHKETIVYVFKKLSKKIKQIKKTLIEKKKLNKIGKRLEFLFLLFSREFLRVIWLFFHKKKFIGNVSQLKKPFFDRSELPFGGIPNLPDRVFRYLGYIKKP